MTEACCTCATLLTNILPPYDEKTEKPALYNRRLSCCGRVICSNCLYRNSRFNTYCPFCQISIQPTSTPLTQDPPPYTSSSRDPLSESGDELPAYSTLHSLQTTLDEKSKAEAEDGEDVLHFLDHDQDTIPSLSLRYGVPIIALRKANNITSDNLLLARRTVVIPSKYYKGGVSLNPRPIGGEEEEIRKSKVRKWMVACKVSEYDVALIYLEKAEYNLKQAIEAYRDDERWEREHPIETSRKGKGKPTQDLGRRRFLGRR